MGYFDGLTAAAFKKDAEGRDLFFIWGKFGKGRVIPSAEDGDWVRSYLKNYYICVLVGIVPMVMMSGEPFQPRWLAFICIFLVLALGGLIPLWRRTRQWPLAGERLTYREAMSASAKAHGTVSLWFLIALGIVMVLGSLLVLLYTDGTVVGGLGVIFFGTCLGLFIWMLCARRRG
jgi:hypothetical protein